MDNRIFNIINQQKISFFVGAGISMIPPSCLPSWWQLNHIILDSLADESHSIVSEVKDLASLIKQREEEGKLPPEFVSEIITNRIGESYFEVLKGLEGDAPNEAHLWLATLAKAGKLKAIITTNFDTLIERAFERMGVPLKVLVDPEDFIEYITNQDFLDEINSPCILVKLHGTASRPKTCVDTLAQRKQGLHPNITRFIDSIGLNTFWIILGYSGADLEADANYLGLRGRADRAPGFVWLHLPESKPLNVVRELSDIYGSDRGIIEYGILPNWLYNFEKIIPTQIKPPEQLILTTDEIQNIKNEKIEKLRFFAHEWANKRGKLESAIILTDIGVQAGYYDKARIILSNMLKDIGENELTSFGFGLIYQELADVAHHFGDNHTALSNYQKSANCFKQANHDDGYYSSLEGVARIQRGFGYYSEAEEALKNYLNYSREIKDEEGEIHALHELGSLYRETGRFNDGLNVHKAAIPIALKLGSEIDRAVSLLGMAMIQSGIGKLQEAETNAKEASDIYSRLGNDGLLSEAYRQLSEIYFNRGDVDESFSLLDQAKEKAERIGDASRTIRAQWIKGNYLMKLGDYSEAVIYLNEAASNAEDLGDIALLVSIIQSVGLVYQMNGNLEKSYEVYQKALGMAEKYELEFKAAGLNNNIGIISELKGQLNEALEYYLKAIEVFQHTGQPESIAQCQGNIGNIYLRLGNLNEALKYYNESYKIFEEIEDIGGILRTKYNMANVIYQLGDIEKAKLFYNDSIELAEQYQQIGLRDNFILNYAGVVFQEENYDEVIRLYEKVFESCLNREDFFLAGMAGYYMGLAYLKKDNKDMAISTIEKSISLWQKLEDVPQQMAEAQQLLDSLSQ